MSERAAPARKSMALARASDARTPGALSTHQSIDTSAPDAIQLRMVPPAPISISSECAPMQSTESALPGRARSSARMSARLHRRVAVDAPRHVALLDHVLEHLAVAQRVHRAPEALVLVGHELVFLDQPRERL